MFWCSKSKLSSSSADRFSYLIIISNRDDNFTQLLVYQSPMRNFSWKVDPILFHITNVQCLRTVFPKSLTCAALLVTCDCLCRVFLTVCIRPWPEAPVKHQNASPVLAGGLRAMPWSIASISPFPKAFYCCCLQNDDLSETAAVAIDVLSPPPPIDRPCQVFWFSEEKSPLASCCTGFDSELP